MDREIMIQFDFKLEDYEIRLKGGLGDGWREMVLLAKEVMELKAEVRKLKKLKKKVVDDD